MGRAAHLRLSGRRHQRHHGRARPRRRRVRVRPGAARGDGAFMACAHAKFTGEVGVCLATSGPGAIHLLNGLYDAKLDHQPVVAIVGQQARAALGGQYQQEVDLRVAVQGRRRRVRRRWSRCRRRCATSSTARCASRSPSAPSPASSCRTTCRSSTRSKTPPRAHGTIHSGLGYSRAAGRADGARSAPRGRAAQRRQEGRDAGRRRRAGRDRRGDRRSPSCSAPASPRRCSARPRCPTTCRSSPARSACSAPSRAGT